MKLMRYLPAIAIFAYALIAATPANSATGFSECKGSFAKEWVPKYTNHTKHIISLCKGGEINFAVSFNKKRRTADFVAYRLTAKMVSAPTIIKRRSSWFLPDPDILDATNKTFQATKASYKHSGFDRGHLIKAEDMKLDTKAYKSTFLFSSIVPQFQKFNRLGWRKVENLPRDKIKKGIFNQVWIIAGVIGTHPRSKYLKDTGVIIPSCFYRVLIGEKQGGYSVIAMLMPNDNKIDNSVIVSDYIVGVNYLEKTLGIDLLPGLNSLDYGLAKWGLGAAKNPRGYNLSCD